MGRDGRGKELNGQASRKTYNFCEEHILCFCIDVALYGEAHGSAPPEGHSAARHPPAPPVPTSGKLKLRGGPYGGVVGVVRHALPLPSATHALYATHGLARVAAGVFYNIHPNGHNQLKEGKNI